jgi:hypothetical protein
VVGVGRGGHTEVHAYVGVSGQFSRRFEKKRNWMTATILLGVPFDINDHICT